MSVLAYHFEFLNEIDVRNHDVCRPANVGVYDSIEEVELRPVLLSVERRIGESRSGNSNVAFDSSDALVLRSRNGGNAGSERQQLSKVPAVQRKRLDSLLLNNRSQFGSGAVDHRRCRRYFDSGRSAANIQLHVLCHGLVDGNLEGRFNCLKPGLLHFQLVGSGLHVHEYEIPVVVRGGGTLDVCALVRKSDGCTGHDGPCGVGDGSVGFTASGLRKCRKGKSDT